jgi:hypothetical protein
MKNKTRTPAIRYCSKCCKPVVIRSPLKALATRGKRRPCKACGGKHGG